MTNNSPPAPEGFAWMPVSGELTDVALAQSSACYPLTGRPVEDSWEHRSCVWASIPEGFSTCRLMRRLGTAEKPWDGCAFLGGCGTWAPKGEPMGEDHILNGSVVAPNAGWYAPVRFPRDHVPDFGGRGLRYLDEGEPGTADAYHYGMSGRVVPITLPPLPATRTVAQRLGHGTPGERDPAAPCDMYAPDSSKGRDWCGGDGHYLCRECVHHSPGESQVFGPGPATECGDGAETCTDDETGKLGQLTRVRMVPRPGQVIAATTPSEVTADTLLAQLAELRTQAETAAHYASMDLSMLIPGGPTRDELRAQLAKVTAERDEMSEAVGVLAHRAQRLVDIGALSSSHAAVLLDPDVTNDI